MINKYGNFRFFLPLGFVLALAGILFAQSTPTKNKMLVINGKNAGPIVRQIDGRSSVDIETLAHFANGVVTIEPTRVVLTLPAAETVAAPGGAAAPTTPGAATGVSGSRLSREFASAAISELAEMREFRGAVTAMITYGLAASGTQAQDLHDQVEAGLNQAQVA